MFLELEGWYWLLSEEKWVRCNWVAARYFHQCNSSQRQTCHRPLQSLSVCHQHISFSKLCHYFQPPFINCNVINFSTKQDKIAINLAKGLPTTRIVGGVIVSLTPEFLLTPIPAYDKSLQQLFFWLVQLFIFSLFSWPASSDDYCQIIAKDLVSNIIGTLSLFAESYCIPFVQVSS